MDRLANAVILSWGLRRWAIALIAGAVSALAHAPYFAFFLLWLTLPVLVWLIDGSVGASGGGRLRRVRPAFAAGWTKPLVRAPSGVAAMSRWTAKAASSSPETAVRAGER